MANCGKDRNNSQFFILTKRNGCSFLDNKYVIFGIIVSGYNIVKKINNIPVIDNKPISDCIISNSGLVSVKSKPLESEVSNPIKSKVSNLLDNSLNTLKDKIINKVYKITI